jgi:2-dehydropantoate 2-reductase
MTDQPNVVVVGAGAMGSLFGGLLADGGLNVTLVDVWAEHIRVIRENGLRLTGQGGDRIVRVAATTDASSVTHGDVAC